MVGIFDEEILQIARVRLGWVSLEVNQSGKVTSCRLHRCVVWNQRSCGSGNDLLTDGPFLQLVQFRSVFRKKERQRNSSAYQWISPPFLFGLLSTQLRILAREASLSVFSVNDKAPLLTFSAGVRTFGA